MGFVVSIGVRGLGYGPAFRLHASGSGTVADLAAAAGVAVVGAAVAACFVGLVHGARRLVAGVPGWVRPPIGGLIVGLLAWWSAGALTFGEAQLGWISSGRLAVGVLAAALVAKLGASAACVATGWRGGFIIPLFFAGAAAAGLVHHAVPSADLGVITAACMVATCVGVTRTPVGAALVVSEMAGLTVMPTTILAALVAMALTGRLSLITSQRARSVPA